MVTAKARKGKKKWHEIRAPKLFNEQELGETYIYESEQLEDKHITTNLMTLTGNPKKQNMEVFFEVTSVEEGVAKTKTLGIAMQHSAVRRFVRKGRSKIEDSFLAKNKNGELVRVKPVIVTRSRVDNEVQRAVRAKTRELIKQTLQKYTFESVVNDIVHTRLQRYLKDHLSAITPVRSAEIRSLKYAQPTEAEEREVEETAYEEREKQERSTKKESRPTTLSDLKAEVEEALAMEKEIELDDEEKEADEDLDEDEDEE